MASNGFLSEHLSALEITDVILAFASWQSIDWQECTRTNTHEFSIIQVMTWFLILPFSLHFRFTFRLRLILHSGQYLVADSWLTHSGSDVAATAARHNGRYVKAARNGKHVQATMSATGNRDACARDAGKRAGLCTLV